MLEIAQFVSSQVAATFPNFSQGSDTFSKGLGGDRLQALRILPAECWLPLVVLRQLVLSGTSRH